MSHLSICSLSVVFMWNNCCFVHLSLEKARSFAENLHKAFQPLVCVGLTSRNVFMKIGKSMKHTEPGKHELERQISRHSTEYVTPQWGAADAEIKVSPGGNTELKRSPFKAWSRSVYSHKCYAYCQGFFPYFYPSGPFTCIFPKPLPISPVLAVANAWFLCRPAQ